jgi:TonB family protein
MAPLPPLGPTPPEPSGTKVRARTRPGLSDDTIWQSDAALIFFKLRKMIASNTQSTEAILGTIAVAAHALTGATGAAVAMPRDGVVICVGRSGETAPELGDLLNVDSGISGECLRTGVIMRCDDASRDFHVDAEVCRQLGLQSIAVVPLRGLYGRVGVLEAFSSESHAFNDEKMEILGRLAGLAEAAWARGAVTESPSTPEDPVTTEMAAFVETPTETAATTARSITPASSVATTVPLTVPLEQVREALATYEVSGNRRKWFIAALTASVLLAAALLSVYGWRAWYKASVTSRASHPAAKAMNAPAQDQDGDSNAGPGLAFIPEVANAAVRPSRNPTVRGPKTKESTPIPDEVIRRQYVSAPAAPPGSAGSSAFTSAASSEEPPTIQASNAQSSDLGSALGAAPVLPKLDVPISQGIAGGVLIHKVQPVYPPEAQRMHVEGKVVIDAIVAVDGRVDEIQLVSGDSRLAPAALQAVGQWRYTPYSLNGKAIPKQTRITISFIAPQ